MDRPSQLQLDILCLGNSSKTN